MVKKSKRKNVRKVRKKVPVRKVRKDGVSQRYWKALNKRAKRKFPKKDWDADGKKNWEDCVPLDPKRQDKISDLNQAESRVTAAKVALEVVKGIEKDPDFAMDAFNDKPKPSQDNFKDFDRIEEDGVIRFVKKGSEDLTPPWEEAPEIPVPEFIEVENFPFDDTIFDRPEEQLEAILERGETPQIKGFTSEKEGDTIRFTSKDSEDLTPPWIDNSDFPDIKGFDTERIRGGFRFKKKKSKKDEIDWPNREQTGSDGEWANREQ